MSMPDKSRSQRRDQFWDAYDSERFTWLLFATAFSSSSHVAYKRSYVLGMHEFELLRVCLKRYILQVSNSETEICNVVPQDSNLL